MQDLLKDYPVRRIKPFDGLAVTSDIWDEAHEYHRQALRYHSLLAHGWGILAGLEVSASDPPDGSIYVRPGVAIDASGRVIAVREPVSYDLGQGEGLLYLVLSYEEGQPRTGECGQVKDVLFVDAQFGLEALAARPAGPYVELARVRRRSRSAAIKDAADPDQPQENELDRRFRRILVAEAREPAAIGVCYAGGPSDRRHGRGAALLAESLRAGGTPAWADDNVPLSSGAALGDYTLLCLVGIKAHQLKREEMTALYGFAQGGGTILVESCRQGITGPAPADASFQDMFASLGLKLDPVRAGHALLTRPNLFALPPDGFETEGTPELSATDAVIFSTADYGCLWQGERRGMPATRDEIRAAMEWGANLVAYAARRRKALVKA